MKDLDDDGRKLYCSYSHLLAEYHISLFSPELKTKTAVSEQKLTKLWRQLKASY